MRFIRMRFSLLFFLVLAGCASRSDLDYLRSDVDELKTRLFTTEKEMGNLRNETREGVEKNLKGLQNDLETVRKGAADIQATIESVKVDMQVVTGKLDDVALSAKKPVDDLSLLQEDTNRRLTALEGHLEKLEKYFEEQKKPAAAKPENPDTLYHEGLGSYKSGDFQKARELFTRFIDQFPTHEMAANARYWLGETYYSEKKYDQAILEFQEVIKNFPGKEKVPAAMLKQGMAFKELGDVKNARYLYKKLVEDFPATEEAKAAKVKLKGL
jgi:tol-pal system protein YbgF